MMTIKKYLNHFLFAVSLLIVLYSCKGGFDMEAQEEAMIQEYLNRNNNLDFELKSSGLYYLELVTGTGPKPVAHDTVFLKYAGKFLDGQVFDSNIGTADLLKKPVGENEFIEGLEEGLSYMAQGGKYTLLIPSKLAYGAVGVYPYIPGYTPLLFDIEVVTVKAGPGK